MNQVKKFSYKSSKIISLNNEESIECEVENLINLIVTFKQNKGIKIRIFADSMHVYVYIIDSF